MFFHILGVLLNAREAGVNLIGEDSFSHMSEPLIALKWRVCRVFNENDPGYLSVLIRKEKVRTVRRTQHGAGRLSSALIHARRTPFVANTTGGKITPNSHCVNLKKIVFHFRPLLKGNCSYFLYQNYYLRNSSTKNEFIWITHPQVVPPLTTTVERTIVYSFWSVKHKRKHFEEFKHPVMGDLGQPFNCSKWHSRNVSC